MPNAIQCVKQHYGIAVSGVHCRPQRLGPILQTAVVSFAAEAAPTMSSDALLIPCL